MINRKMIAISPRDIEIMTFIFINKVVSLKQVHRYYFKNTTASAPIRRMNKLVENGFVKKNRHIIGSHWQTIYCILEKGLNMIQPHLTYKVDLKRYYSSSIDHDLMLADLTKVFKKMNLIQTVHTESELLSCSEFLKSNSLLPFIELRSDRVCYVEGREGFEYLALEYERKLKSKIRNKKKIEDYYLHSLVPAVLYVCEDRTILKSLMKTDSLLCSKQESKLFFCLRSDVYEGASKVTFKRFDGETLVLE